MSKARKRPTTSVHRDTASSSSVDFASEEETSSSSAAAPTGGRNGKAPRRTALRRRRLDFSSIRRFLTFWVADELVLQAERSCAVGLAF